MERKKRPPNQKVRDRETCRSPEIEIHTLTDEEGKERSQCT